MENRVKKNNDKLSDYFSLEIGNLLSRDYIMKGKPSYLYTSTIFDFDRYETFNAPDFETRRVKNVDKIISVSEGDLIISLISQYATVVRTKEKMLLSPNYIKVTPKDKKIPKEYFVYWFNESHDARKQIEQGTQGSIISKLSISFLRELQFSPHKNMVFLANLYALTLKKKELFTVQINQQLQLVKGIYQNEK